MVELTSFLRRKHFLDKMHYLRLASSNGQDTFPQCDVKGNYSMSLVDINRKFKVLVHSSRATSYECNSLQNFISFKITCVAYKAVRCSTEQQILISRSNEDFAHISVGTFAYLTGLQS